MESILCVPRAGYVCGTPAGIFWNPATMSFPLRQNNEVVAASVPRPAQPLSRIAYGHDSSLHGGIQGLWAVALQHCSLLGYH